MCLRHVEERGERSDVQLLPGNGEKWPHLSKEAEGVESVAQKVRKSIGLDQRRS